MDSGGCNNKPFLLDKPVKNFIDADKKQKIERLSPKAEDGYAEYRDQAFLDLFGNQNNQYNDNSIPDPIFFYDKSASHIEV